MHEYASTPSKLIADPEEMHMHHNPDFMMTMSPTVNRGRNVLDMHTEDTTVDNSVPPSNYHSHAKISGRSGKKHSVEPITDRNGHQSH